MSAKLQYSISEQQPMPEREQKNSLEPSRCKDATSGAGSLKDKHVVPRFLIAPLISCRSASRSTQQQLIQPCSTTGAGWGHLCHPEGKQTKRRAETAKGIAGRLG